jgi:hypothetical protein
VFVDPSRPREVLTPRDATTPRNHAAPDGDGGALRATGAAPRAGPEPAAPAPASILDFSHSRPHKSAGAAPPRNRPRSATTRPFRTILGCAPASLSPPKIVLGPAASGPVALRRLIRPPTPCLTLAIPSPGSAVRTNSDECHIRRSCNPMSEIPMTGECGAKRAPQGRTRPANSSRGGGAKPTGLPPGSRLGCTADRSWTFDRRF